MSDLAPLGDWQPRGGFRNGPAALDVSERAFEAPSVEIEEAEVEDDHVDDDVVDQPVSASGRLRPSQATQIVELAADAELFHSPQGDAFARITVDGHRETWPLRTSPFRRWLQRVFHVTVGSVPNAQAIQDALGVLEGKALFDGLELPVFVRLGQLGGSVYLDLGNEHWQAVEITPAGWRVVDDPPVRFRRPNGLLALPMPVTGGSIDDLRPFLNVVEADWPLLVAWLLATLEPLGPYPVLALHGEQGAAKSSTARILRELVDPNVIPLRGHPREERDLMIAARNGWVLAFDNLSHLPDWLSDALCRLSTGGGLATRALYTDTDEVLFAAKRPVLLTGIEELATRGDLLDRALIITLPTIPELRRQTEDKFWGAFNPLRGRLLGVLLDAVAAALGRRDGVELERLPRMADFAVWVSAAEPGLGWEEGTFLGAYDVNRAEAHELSLDASLIAQPVRELAADGFLGTASELLALLRERVGEDITKQKAWPKDGSRLSGALRRIAPNLRAVGVEVEFDLPRRAIRLGTQNSVHSVHSVQPEASAGADLHGEHGRHGEMQARSSEAERLEADYGHLFDGGDK